MDGANDLGRATGAAELFREHAAFVARFLVRLGVARDDVEDLVQEVFLTAHRRGGFVPGPAKATTWLAEIALRVASTAKRTRRRKPRHPSEGVDEAPAPAANPVDQAAAREALARVERALGDMDLDKRSVFVLFEIEGEPCESIAAGLGVPVGTVYSRLHAARRQFVDAYRKLGGEGDGP
jgi:RNA polymerase sigma-70 factor (ECF subfamily)